MLLAAKELPGCLCLAALWIRPLLGRPLLLACLVFGFAGTPTAVKAGWFTKLIREAAEAGGSAARKGAKLGRHLGPAAAHLRKINLPGHRPGLAAEITEEGHWRFVNKSGETYTAGTPEELQRAFTTLLPENAAGAEKGLKPAIYLTEQSIFKQRALLKDLPDHGPLFVVIDKKSYRLLLRGSGKGTRVFAALRRNLTIEMTAQAAFKEAYWQMNRAFRRADIRLLSLQPGSKGIVPAARRPGKAGAAIKPELADPFALAKSMASIRGQTVLLSGRIEGEFLHFQPAKGGPGAVRLAKLRAAADTADVNLIMLNASRAAQPGARNWLWQRTSVNGMERAMKAKTRADFIEALAGGRGAFVVKTKLYSDGRRVSLETAPLASDSLLPSTDGLSDIFSEGVSHLAGELVSQSIDAYFVSRDRQEDLDLRLVSWIPANYQGFYFGSILLALVSLPVSRGWWRRIWPLEERRDYAGRFGFYAARAVRFVVFVLVFMPLAAFPALVVYFLQFLWHWLSLPARAWRQHAGKRKAG